MHEMKITDENYWNILNGNMFGKILNDSYQVSENHSSILRFWYDIEPTNMAHY